MGGDAIKCDRWIGELLVYFGITLLELERILVSAGISLSLFDATVWSYCEMYVGRTANFAAHFARLLNAEDDSALLN